jgi:uncharacterized repeat protein (TIGR01451 family)
MKRHSPILASLLLAVLVSAVLAYTTQWGTHFSGSGDLGQWDRHNVGACSGQQHWVDSSSAHMRAADGAHCFGAYYRENSTRSTFPTDQDMRVMWRWRYPEWGWFGTQAGQLTGRYGWPQYYGVSAVDNNATDYAHVEANGPWGHWDVDSPIWRTSTRDTSWHTSVFDFICDGTQLTWFVDGNQVLSRSGSALPVGHNDRPYQFWFGNLLDDAGPESGKDDWTGFDLDYLYVYAVERPAMNTPSPGSGGTQPVTWNAVPNTQLPDGSTPDIEYQVRACADPNCASVTTTAAWQPGTAYTFTGLQVNRTYYYQVRARWVTQPGLTTCWGAALPATMAGSPAISLSKSATAQAGPGEVVNYTLVAQNPGSGPASGVAVRDPIPQYILNPTGISNGGSGQGSEIVWDIGALSAGQSRTLTWRGTVDPAIPISVTQIVNIATAADNAGHGDQAQATTSILIPAIELAKTAPATVKPGEAFIYTLIVANTGNTTLRDVAVHDPLPQYILNPSNISHGGTVRGDEIAWSLGTMTPGQSLELTWQATVDPAIPVTVNQILNRATVTTSTGLSDQAEATSQVQKPEMEVVKAATTPVIPGDVIDYRIEVINRGATTLYGVVARDPVPQYILSPANISGGGTLQGNEILWNIGDIPAGERRTLTWQATVDPAILPDMTELINVATATAQGGLTEIGVALTEVKRPEMAVVKTAAPLVIPGEVIDYRIEVVNRGNITLYQVRVEDRVPPYVAPAAISDGGYEIPGGIVWDNTGDIPAGESRAVTWRGQVDPLIPPDVTELLNVAVATAQGGLTEEGQAGSEVLRPLLELEKEASASAYAGDEIAYLLRLTNHGPGLARFVEVRDPLPAHTGYVPDVSPTTYHYGTLEGQEVVWRLNELGPGQSTELRWRAQVDVDVPPAVESIPNLALATSLDTPDPITATAQTLLLDPRLELSKTCPDFAQAGDAVTYQLHIGNGGTGTVRDALLREPLPGGMAYVPGSASGGGRLVGTELVWELGTLAAGAELDLAFALQTAPGLDADSVASTTALYSADEVLIQRSCQTALAIPTLAITKTALAQALANDVIEYVIAVENTGPVVAHNAILVDTLPSGADYVPGTASNGGQVGDGIITWLLGDVAPGRQVERRLQVQVHAPQGVDDARIYNEAVATADRAVPVRDQAITLVPRPVLHLAKSAPAEVRPGEIVDYTLAGGNLGPGLARQAVLEDQVPEGLVVLEDTLGEGGYYVAERHAVVWPLGDLGAGTAVERAFQVLVPLSIRPGSRSLDNLAFISSPDAAPASAHASAAITATFTVVGLKLASPYAEPGGRIDYTLQVHNGSPNVVDHVVIRDPLPEYTRYITDTASLPPAFEDGGRTLATQRVLRWTIGMLAPGETYEVRFVARVAEEVPDWLDRVVNVAQVSYSGGGFEVWATSMLPGVQPPDRSEPTPSPPTPTPGPCCRPGDPTVTPLPSRPPIVSISPLPTPTPTLAPTPLPGPALRKSVSPASVEAGQVSTVTWTLVFSNPTSLTIGGLTVRDPLPIGLAYLDSSPGSPGGQIEITGDLTRTVVVANLGDVAGGSRAEIVIRTLVASDTQRGTAFTNTASYSALNVDPGVSNAARVTVEGVAILPVTGGLLDPCTSQGRVTWCVLGLVLLGVVCVARRRQRRH